MHGICMTMRRLVKARWDRGFRLVKDAAAFKELTTL